MEEEGMEEEDKTEKISREEVKVATPPPPSHAKLTAGLWYAGLWFRVRAVAMVLQAIVRKEKGGQP